MPEGMTIKKTGANKSDSLFRSNSTEQFLSGVNAEGVFDSPRENGESKNQCNPAD